MSESFIELFINGNTHLLKLLFVALTHSVNRFGQRLALFFILLNIVESYRVERLVKSFFRPALVFGIIESEFFDFIVHFAKAFRRFKAHLLLSGMDFPSVALKFRTE